MGRGIVESGLFRSERYQLELRTSDPSTYYDGEAWIRNDLAPDTDQLATLRFNKNGTLIDLPIYDNAATTDGVSKAWQVEAGGDTGFIPITTNSPTYPALKFQHSGSVYGVHDSLTAGSGSAIPDSVVSRPDDNNASNNTNDSLGLIINPNSDFRGVGARISSQTVNPTRARLYDFNASSYIETVDISGLSAGDTFAFSSDIVSGQDYGIEIDDPNDGFIAGFYDVANYPYTGSDIDIVGRSTNGSEGTEFPEPIAVNDIGNPDGVLG